MKRIVNALNPSDRPRVLLLIETSTSWGTGLCEGIARYAQKHGGWRFTIEPTGKNDQLRLPRNWQGEGILARVNSKALSDDLIRSSLPAVNLSWYHFGFPAIPRCTADEAACAELALEHLVDRGFSQFAYIGPRNRPGYVDRMGARFIELVEARDCSCTTFSTRYREPTTDIWADQSEDLLAWLTAMPKPVGIFAWGGFQARRVTQACTSANLSIPDEVSILASEWDELMELMASPVLSAVDQNPHRVGYESAGLLDKLMNGESLPTRPLLIPPKTVIAGPSTDMFAYPNKDIVRALRYIHSHLRERIFISTLAEHLDLSRRTVEKLFRQHLHRSPADEIRRQRIEYAKQLFVCTDWSIAQVRNHCGFRCTESFTRAFRKEIGVTPREYLSVMT